MTRRSTGRLISPSGFVGVGSGGITPASFRFPMCLYLHVAPSTSRSPQQPAVRATNLATTSPLFVILSIQPSHGNAGLFGLCVFNILFIFTKKFQSRLRPLLTKVDRPSSALTTHRSDALPF